jgi:uncharacterized protein (TIGR02391 family)
MTDYPREKALRKLRRLIEQSKSLEQNTPEHYVWVRNAKSAILHIFGDQSAYRAEFRKWSSPAFQSAVLESAAKEIEEFWDHPTPSKSDFDFWQLIHPIVHDVARKRFEAGHFADSVEAAFKEINSIIKVEVRSLTGKEDDGATLMTTAFSANSPIIKLDDLGTGDGKNIQTGFMQLFSGSMTGIRNPKAHGNIVIDQARAIHFLFLASLLMNKFDERKR